MSLLNLSAGEMREGLLKGDFNAVELTEAHLERIAATNEDFGSFLVVSPDRALASAKAADLLIKEKGDSSPTLCGIPVSIKDMLLEQGVESRAASKILSGFIPPYSSTAVNHLKNKGAVILGRTNQDEFGMGSSNENSAFSPVKNPWDRSKVPGGSSGGSAAAVALCQSAISLGTDTGGSVRQPASLTGTVGIKPTYGAHQPSRGHRFCFLT